MAVRTQAGRALLASVVVLWLAAAAEGRALPPAAITVPSGRISAVQFAGDGHVLALGTHYFGGLWAADSRDGTLQTRGPGDFVFPVRDLRWEAGAVSPDGTVLATFEDRGFLFEADVKLWDIATGEEIAVLPDGGGPVVFSPDGSMLATGRASARLGATVVLWDVASRQEAGTLTGAGGPMAFLPGGDALATGGLRGNVTLWSVPDGREIASLDAGYTAQAITVSPDGLRLAVGGPHGEVQLWDIATRQEVATQREHTDYVASVAFSPDGRTLASGSADRAVSVWDGRSGERLTTLYGHTNGVQVVAFSPDGATLVSGGWDGRIQRWVGPPWRGAEEAVTAPRDPAPAIDPGVNGVVYNCAFPNTPQVDGLLIEPVWDNAPWHSVDHTRTADAYARPGEDAPGPTDDRDASYEFAMVADAEFLYVALRVTDDYLVPRPVGFARHRTGECADYSVPAQDGATFTDGSPPAPHHDSVWIEPLPAVDRPSLWSGVCAGPVWLDLVRDDTGAWSVIEDAPAEIVANRRLRSKAALTRATWGYRIEAAIPLTDAWPWNVTPADGGAIPISIGLVDADAVSSADASDAVGYAGALYLWDGLHGGRVGMGPTPIQLASEYRAAMPWGWMGGDWGFDALVGDLRFVRAHLSEEMPLPAPGATLALAAGMNLLHVPAVVDGLGSAADLYEALGGEDDVSVLLAPDAAGTYLAYTAGVADDSPANFAISPSLGVIAVLKRAKTVSFVGSALPPTVRLHRGVNQVGIPRRTAVARVGELYDLSADIKQIVRYVHGGFVAVVSDATDAYVAPGVAYLVVASADIDLTLDGEPWRGRRTPLAAPPAGGYARARSGAVMVVIGTGPQDGQRVRVTDVDTGVSVVDVVGATSGSGNLQAAFVRLGAPFAAGDAFRMELLVEDGIGRELGGRRLTLTEEDVRLGAVSVALTGRQTLVAPFPASTRMLANYPNPFNPETWIPFDMSEASRVTVAIHEATGRVVRRLDIGRRGAGSYRSRAEAIHWDGRNDRGETVAAGVYYAEMTTSATRHVRRLVVVK